MKNPERKKVELGKIIEFASGIQIKEIRNILYSGEGPENDGIHFMPRLSFLLSGECIFHCWEDDHYVHKHLCSPGVYYCKKEGYQNCLKEILPLRTISFCYLPGYIRVTSVMKIRSGLKNKIMSDYTYYHSTTPLSPGGLALLHTFETLWEQGNEQKAARRLLQELLDLTLRELATTPPAPTALRSRIWNRLNLMLRSSRNEKVSRAQAAKLCGISPGYVTKLVQRYAGCDFAVLTENYRMEHATSLLQKMDISIDEIAELCGYRYRSYFDRRFKLRYGITPRQYRNTPEMHIPQEKQIPE